RSFVGVAASEVIPGGSDQITHPAAILENASICDNEFIGLTYAVFLAAHCGMLRCENNFAHNVDGGFYFSVKRPQKSVAKLRFIANKVVVLASKSDEQVLPGVRRSGLIASFEKSTESVRSTLVMQSNELTGALPLPIALVEGPMMAVVTGNLVCN